MESKLDRIKEFAERAYQPPKACNPTDIHDLDEIKLHELRECFNLFDLNNDGFLCASDLHGTFKTMGIDAPDEQVQEMLGEASQPLDFDSFAMMMCFKTMEMEPEIIMLEALSKWDEKIQGVISLERLYTCLINYSNDKLTEEEAKWALEEAPTVEKTGLRGLLSPSDRWIDYLSWVEKIAGFRKPTTRLYLD